MLPTVFLSLSGSDEAFVNIVQEHLPDGMAHFYPRSFLNGENLVAAMEERVGKATVFAFFASKASVESCWVNFELDRARLANIRNPKFRILVFPISGDIAYRELPVWMREYWIPSAGTNPRDVARYIRNVLASGALNGASVAKPFGRGIFLDAATRQVQENFLSHKNTANIFLFAGNEGITPLHAPTSITLSPVLEV